MRRPRTLGVLAGAAMALGVATPALAVEGNLYAVGPGTSGPDPQFFEARSGANYSVNAPELRPAYAGTKWEMGWSCPVAGSELAHVEWTGARTAAASSLEVRVVANGTVVWAAPDVALPLVAQGAQRYGVALPGGVCGAQLRLAQVERRDQHARGYVVNEPRVLVRDTAAPVVSLDALPAGWIGGGAPVAVGWTASDNFGGDGMVAHRILVAGGQRWSGGAGPGSHTVAIGTDGLPDGTHRVVVRVEGDGTGAGEASGTIHVDRTPPTLDGGGATSTGRPGGAQFTWSTSDNLSGVASTVVEVNTAADGSASGAWREVARSGSSGGRTDVDLRALGDGIHAWRVRAGDRAGNQRHAPGPGTVLVDTTPPVISATAFVRAAPERVRASWRATDAHAGTASAAVQGWTGSSWRTLGTTGTADGAGALTVDTAALVGPASRFRLVVTDAVGNAGEATGELGSLGAGPSISDLTLRGGPPWSLTWSQSDPDGFGSCPTTVEVSGPRAGDAWRELASGRRGAGAQRLALSTDGLEPGSYRVRVTACDAEGVSASATVAGLVVAGSPTPRPAITGVAPAAGAHLSAEFRGAARVLRRGRDELEVKTVVQGSTVVIVGGLVDANGVGIPGVPVEVRGARGRLLGRASTGPRGRLRVAVRPDRSGSLRFAVPTTDGLVPLATPVALEVEVRPRVELRASAVTVASGGRLIFTGRVGPAPRRIGVPRKSVVLEWRDPIRDSWRPVVIAPLKRDGSFRIGWRFNLSGITIPMRLRVPGEAGWPLLPATSRIVAVRVAG